VEKQIDNLEMPHDDSPAPRLQTRGNWSYVFKQRNEILFLRFLLLETTNPEPLVANEGQKCKPLSLLCRIKPSTLIFL